MNITTAWSFTTLLSVLSVLACQTATAAVVLEGTRIIHDAGKGRDATLKSVNSGEHAALVQAWIDTGDSHMRPEDVRIPLRITPSVPRLLQPQESQAWRITYAPRPSDEPLPQDRESLFYFNLLDIPPKPTNAQGGNLLQFAVRSRIKLFHRPAGLQGNAADAPAQLVWRQGDRVLEVFNPTAYHVTLSSVMVGDGLHLDADMVAPTGQITVPLPQGHAAPATVRFTWLDDYGAIRDAEAIVQSPSSEPTVHAAP